MVARISVGATKADVRRVAAENPTWRVELEPGGTLTVSPPAGGGSGARNATLTAMMRDWARTRDYVVFDSSTGFELPDGSVVSPDTSLVALNRWSKLSPDEREDFPALAPDIAIELLSKTDRPAALRDKLTHLRAQGTGFVVLLDPYRRDIWTAGQSPPDFPTDFDDVFCAGDVNR